MAEQAMTYGQADATWPAPTSWREEISVRGTMTREQAERQD